MSEKQLMDYVCIHVTTEDEVGPAGVAQELHDSLKKFKDPHFYDVECEEYENVYVLITEGPIPDGHDPIELFGKLYDIEYAEVVTINNLIEIGKQCKYHTNGDCCVGDGELVVRYAQKCIIVRMSVIL